MANISKTPSNRVVYNGKFNPTGNCKKCNSQTYLTCERCMEFYCSVNCQLQDWHEHRIVCFPMPQLVPSPAYIAKNSPNTGKESSNEPAQELSNIKLDQGDIILEHPQRQAPASFPKAHNNNGIIPSNLIENPFDGTSDKPISGISVKVSAPPQRNTKVIITYIHNHRCIFIRSVEPKEELNYQKIQTDCAEYEKIAMPLTALPSKGHIVLAKFHLDGIYYRALVIKAVNENSIKVVFIDFGNIEKTKLSELKHLREDLQQRRVYNFRVLLDGVDENLNDQNVMKLLGGLVRTKIFKLLYDDTNPLIDALVKLVDAVTGEIVNDRVNILNRVTAVPLTDINTSDIVCVDDIMNRNEELPLIEKPIGLDALEKVDISGCDVELVVLNNAQLCINQISCVRQKDLEELVINFQSLQTYCTKVQGTYSPRLYEMCLAFSDGSWNRGQCIHVYGDENPCILFIEDGSTQKVHVDKILKMPKEFLHRYVTVDCTIHGFEDSISDEDCKRLKAVLEVGKIITAKRAKKIESRSCKYSKDKYKIQLPDILAAFQDKYV